MSPGDGNAVDTVAELIEQGLRLEEVGDFDSAQLVLDQVRRNAGPDDVAVLVAGVRSPRASFWTREMLAEPLAVCAGTGALVVLVQAHRLGLDEGHDNDTLSMVLIDLVEQSQDEARKVLDELRSDERFVETAEWLLEFCE